MRVLITNDDGIDSAGLGTLAEVASRLGHEVVAAAPSWDSSGASASLTAALARDGRLLIERRELAGLDTVEAYAVEAAPAFIVRAATTGVFGDPPELVLSGINQGPNTGHAILHSGTVGAAFTAATFGLPAAAVSLVMGPTPQWGTAAVVAEAAVSWVVDLDPPFVLNVNVPDVDVTRLAGFARAELAPFGAVQATVTERGEGYVRLAYEEIRAGQDDEHTDAALVARGFATYTVVRAVCAVENDALAGAPTLETR